MAPKFLTRQKEELFAVERAHWYNTSRTSTYSDGWYTRCRFRFDIRPPFDYISTTMKQTNKQVNAQDKLFIFL